MVPISWQSCLYIIQCFPYCTPFSSTSLNKLKITESITFFGQPFFLYFYSCQSLHYHIAFPLNFFLYQDHLYIISVLTLLLCNLKLISAFPYFHELFASILRQYILKYRIFSLNYRGFLLFSSFQCRDGSLFSVTNFLCQLMILLFH